MSVKQILDEIANEPGTNKKMEILAKYKDNELLKEVIYLAMSPRVNFYIKKVPDYMKSSDMMTLNVAMVSLKRIKDREVTGSAAQAKLASILGLVRQEDAEVVKKIIAKDLRIGMGSTNVNKVFKGLIEETPYMGAKSFSVKLAKAMDYPAISQVKMDGRYANAIVEDGVVKLESRQGEDNTLSGALFVKELEKLPDGVYNGELTIPGYSRYESNGIIASVVSIQGKMNKGEDISKDVAKLRREHLLDFHEVMAKVQYTAWDYLTLEEYANAASDVPYGQRLLKLIEHIAFSDHLDIVEGKTVKNYEEAMEHFNEILARGEEGTILKSLNKGWKDGKPNWQVKMKLEMDIDLRIRGFQQGTGKNSHVYSALIVESDDGRIITKVPGMDEKTMDFVTANANQLLDTVVEVKSCGLSLSKEGATYALLHPCFKRFRDDKNTTDTLESAKQIENMVKGLV